MQFNDYQKASARTLADIEPNYDNLDLQLLRNALGLVGEAGEVAEAIKKQVCHRHGIDREAIAKEMGDVCWYLAALATVLDLDLSDIAEANVEKLRQRYPNGFTVADSIDSCVHSIEIHVRKAAEAGTLLVTDLISYNKSSERLGIVTSGYYRQSSWVMEHVLRSAVAVDYKIDIENVTIVHND